MSEPITRADLDMLVATAIERVAKMTPAEREEMMEAQRQSWVRGELGLSKAESASPPRIPVSSIDNAQQRGHLRKCEECQGIGTITVWGAIAKSWSCPKCEGTGNVPVGVESEPGQPMPFADRITQDAAEDGEVENYACGIWQGTMASATPNVVASLIARIRKDTAENARLREHIARDMDRVTNAYREGIEAAAALAKGDAVVVPKNANSMPVPEVLKACWPDVLAASPFAAKE